MYTSHSECKKNRDPKFTSHSERVNIKIDFYKFTCTLHDPMRNEHKSLVLGLLAHPSLIRKYATFLKYKQFSDDGELDGLLIRHGE